MKTKQKRNTSKQSLSLKELVRETSFTKSLFKTLFIIFFAVLLVWLMTAAWQQYTANQRAERITEIYQSFELDESYVVQVANVFGEKRVYEWDPSRTYSSTIQYLRHEPVDKTFAETRVAIESAGFRFINEAYKNSPARQYHFTNDKGEYVRLSVESKPFLDAIVNRQSQSVIDTIDRNSKPSIVTLKVNLDDNNE